MFSALSRSSSRTRRPRFNNSMVAVTPAMPAPITITSVEYRIIRPLRGGWRGAKSNATGIIPRMSIRRRPRESLSLPEARRVALAAQGFGRQRPDRDIVKADVVRTVRALGLLQIDSVNVLVRSHYLPLFSRLGAYAMPLLDEAAYGGRRRQVFEYWGHEASLLPVECQPLLRWRMQRAKNGDGTWGNVAQIRARPCRLLRRGARGNSRSRPARRVRDRHRRPPQGQLVGLERRQDCARMVVLDRTGHHAFAATLRARV